MRKTNESSIDLQNRVTLSMSETAGFLGCGRKTAEKIASDAGAIVRVGRRVLISRNKLERYIESLTR